MLYELFVSVHARAVASSTLLFSELPLTVFSCLLTVLQPKHIAEAIKSGKKVEPEQHDLVTIVFRYVQDFEIHCRHLAVS